MTRFKNILVATDTRLDSHPIVDEAVEIARQNNASLRIVDVVPEFPWTVRMTLQDHENVRWLIARDKQDKLDRLTNSIRDKGINAESKVLWGETSVEIVREVLRGRNDLVLRVAKGHDSSYKGSFGVTGRRLLRDCPCAVWLVADANTPGYKHIMGCIDTSTGHEDDTNLNHNVYELASAVSRQHDARLSIVHAWSIDMEDLLERRMNRDEFEKMRNRRRRCTQDSLNKFLQPLGAQANDSHIHLVKGTPPSVIPGYASEHGADLIVMGTVARSGLAGMVIGNTAEWILDNLECSVLAVKSNSFVSPISHAGSINISAELVSS